MYTDEMTVLYDPAPLDSTVETTEGAVLWSRYLHAEQRRIQADPRRKAEIFTEEGMVKGFHHCGLKVNAFKYSALCRCEDCSRATIKEEPRRGFTAA